MANASTPAISTPSEVDLFPETDPTPHQKEEEAEVKFYFPDDAQTGSGVPVPIPPSSFARQLELTLAETERFEAHTSATGET